MAARGETQANVEVSTLVVPAWRLRWRAPELALVLGERALALATSRQDEADRLRAEALVVFAGNRVGRGVRIADRAIDALKAAEAAGDHVTAWLLRVELAACARSVGAPLTGFAAVTPVLEAPDVPAELRASALVQASECLVTVGRGDEPTRALAEADQLYVADTSLDDDTRLLLRGLIRAVQAAQHRRWGDIAAAIGAAREGLDLLGRFSDPSADSGQGLGRLTLELVLSLMDANRLLDASEVGTPLLDRPVRAPSASTSGWLRLALATRVHLPAGRVALAREMLRDAAVSAERHQLDTLLAESLLALAHVHEVSGELADALTNLRAAHAAERRRARAVYSVRARLAAEFSGVHRQPADLHQQLAGLLRPVEGVPVVIDGVLSAALKQQLRQWRPVQVRKGDGLKVKRVRRAAEDMTVEGLSAARQHAADRWRMVQAFGEPEDKTPEPIEPPPPPPPPPPAPSSDRTVPASGLIASAGAMVSGRRRAARVAAGEIDDEPGTGTETPLPATPEPAQLTPDQERKRKIEQQLMELQREARRQIEAERQVRADQRAKAEREARAAEEAARQAAEREEAARREVAAREEAAREEAARQKAARQAAAREEAGRREAARQAAERETAARQAVERETAAREESARQEATRQAAERETTTRQAAERETPARGGTAHHAAARDDASRSQPESVLDMLKAQGLRAGGRRRARDAEPESETPSWRVEPPTHRRRDDQGSTPAPSPSQNFFADPTAPAGAESRSSQDSFSGAHSATADHPNYFADPSAPDAPGRTGLAAAFSRPPATPDFGPHLDDPLPGSPAYPLVTPAEGFPAISTDATERNLPDLDYSALDFTTPSAPRWSTASIPSPDPAEQPDPARPGPAKPIPEPEPEREPEKKPLPPLPDPIPSVPTPDEIPQSPQPDLLSNTFLSSADVDDDTSDLPTIPVRAQRAPDQPASTQSGGDPSAQPGFGTQPTFGTHTFGTQAGFGTQTGFGSQSSFGTQPYLGTPGLGAQPDSGSQSGHGGESDAATAAGPAGQPGPDAATSAGSPTPSDFNARPGQGSQVDPAARYDFADRPEFATALDQAAQLGFATSAASAAQADVEQTADVGTGAEAALATPAESTEPTDAAQPAEDESASQPGDPEGGTRTGRPSSRRKPSDLSLGDLLAEALVAYETGRRSDEEFEAADLAAQNWSAIGTKPPASEQPSAAEQSHLAERPAEAEQPSTSDSYFQPGQSFSPQPPASEPAAHLLGSDFRFQPGPSFGTPSPEAAVPEQASAESKHSESYFQPGRPYEPEHSLASEPQTGRESYFSSFPEHPFGTEPAKNATPESEQEKTGPIVPVGAAPDSETTGPIRPVRSDGPGGWTLPSA